MSKEARKTKKSAGKIIISVIDWIIGIFVVLIAAVEITALATRSKNYGVPNFFGNQVSVVQTDSMAYDEKGNELYSVGTAVFSHKTDFHSLKNGDDVSFYNYVHVSSETGTASAPFVHRVIAYVPTGTNDITFSFGTEEKHVKKSYKNEFGYPYYIVMGANISAKEGITTHHGQYQIQFVFENDESNNSCLNAYKQGLSYNSVLLPDYEDPSRETNYDVNGAGVYMGKVIGSSKFVGGLYTFLEKPLSLLLIVIIPCIIIALSSIYDIIRAKDMKEEEEEKKKTSAISEEAKTDDKKAAGSASDPLSGYSEEEKEELKQQLLQQLLEEQQKGDKK